MAAITLQPHPFLRILLTELVIAGLKPLASANEAPPAEPAPDAPEGAQQDQAAVFVPGAIFAVLEVTRTIPHKMRVSFQATAPDGKQGNVVVMFDKVDLERISAPVLVRQQPGPQVAFAER